MKSKISNKLKNRTGNQKENEIFEIICIMCAMYEFCFTLCDVCTHWVLRCESCVDWLVHHDRAKQEKTRARSVNITKHPNYFSIVHVSCCICTICTPVPEPKIFCKWKNLNQIALVSMRWKGDYEECWNIIMHRDMGK